MKPRVAGYYLVLGAGILVMLFALWLHFDLDVSERLRYDIVGVVGIAGIGIATLARLFKPKP